MNIGDRVELHLWAILDVGEPKVERRKGMPLDFELRSRKELSRRIHSVRAARRKRYFVA